jgi:hypothetical protein
MMKTPSVIEPKYLVDEDWWEGTDGSACKFWVVKKVVGLEPWQHEIICECRHEANAHMIAACLNKVNTD